MKRQILAGSTDQTIDIFIQDSSSTIGAGLTGLVFNTASLTCYYRKGATGTPTALTLATQTVGGAHSDGGFVAVDGTNCPGQYRLDLSDTIVAAAGAVTLYLRGATNMAPCLVELEVVNFCLTGQSATDLKDFADDGYDPSTNKVQGVVLVDTLTTYTGNTPQTGDGYAIVNSGTHGNAAIKGYVDDIGVAGAGLTAIPWNAAWDAEVQSEVDDALVAQRLDELLNADSDIDGAAPPTVGSVFHELMSKTAGSFTFDQTTDSCEAIRDRGDAAWITATGFSTHSAADVWAVATRVLTAGTNIQLPSNGLANVTAWTVNITGNLSGSVGSIATGGIAAASFAAGAIDAAAIAANAIGASELAADAVAEIQSGLSTLDAAGVRAAIGLGSANLDTQLDALPTNAELATALGTADDAVLAAIAALSIPTAAQNATAVLTTQMTESYNTDGTAPTLAQAVFVTMQGITEFAISGTTKTVKKIDGSTTAYTETLDSSTAPTSITRAT